MQQGLRAPATHRPTRRAEQRANGQLPCRCYQRAPAPRPARRNPPPLLTRHRRINHTLCVLLPLLQSPNALLHIRQRAVPRVTLRPRKGTDAQDLLYAGMSATVEAVVRDVDGEPHLLVTIDGDPAAELHRWYGRFHYYRLDEVEP